MEQKVSQIKRRWVNRKVVHKYLLTGPKRRTDLGASPVVEHTRMTKGMAFTVQIIGCNAI